MMMKLEPSRLSGKVRAVTSKSAAHRGLICAALSDKETELRISHRSADIDATADCLRAMGAEIQMNGELCRVTPIVSRNSAELNCRESGSTLRFLLPVAAALCGNVCIRGEGRLPERPLGPLARALGEHGVRISALTDEQPALSLPLLVSGELESGVYKIEGNISSQYISGLLFALPLLNGGSRIEILSPMESSAYVDMTLETLAHYGIQIEVTPKGYLIPGNQSYRSRGVMNIEGDWSNAAFFLAAGAVGGDGIVCEGLNSQSAQGDRTMPRILREFGASVKGTAVGPGRLSGREINVSQIPDLMPILAVVACRAEGRTVLCGAGRLRLKESDRITSAAALINDLGGRAEEGPDSLIVYGTGSLKGGRVRSFGDHRIAMSAAIAALFCEEPVYLEQAEAVNKSYPTFFTDYNALGGKAYVV